MLTTILPKCEPPAIYCSASRASWNSKVRSMTGLRLLISIRAFISSNITREPTKVLLVAARRTPDLAARLAAVINAYKARFRQQSVGIITRDACASF